MAQDLFQPERFKLPTRIRTVPRNDVGLQFRLQLVDRIADLQDISVSEGDGDTVPCRVDVYLQQVGDVPAGQDALTRRLCSLSRDGLKVYGLDRWGRYQVVSRGWGTLDDASVRLELPRNDTELDVVWRVVRRAYDAQHESSRELSPKAITSTGAWPRFSRTSLQ